MLWSALSKMIFLVLMRPFLESCLVSNSVYLYELKPYPVPLVWLNYIFKYVDNKHVLEVCILHGRFPIPNYTVYKYQAGMRSTHLRFSLFYLLAYLSQLPDSPDMLIANLSENKATLSNQYRFKF